MLVLKDTVSFAFSTALTFENTSSRGKGCKGEEIPAELQHL